MVPGFDRLVGYLLERVKPLTRFEHATRNAEEMGRPVEVFPVQGVALSARQIYSYPGYAVRFLANAGGTGLDNDLVARLWFHDDPNADPIVLLPGEGYATERGFRRFWLEVESPSGATFLSTFEVQRDPLSRPERMPQVLVSTQGVRPLNAVGPTFEYEYGVVEAPAAGDVIADTGVLPEGVYEFAWHHAGEAGSVAVGTEIQHRNAANTDNNWMAAGVISYLSTTAGVAGKAGPVAVAQNERLRIITAPGGVAGTAAKDYMATIFYRRVGNLNP